MSAASFSGVSSRCWIRIAAPVLDEEARVGGLVVVHRVRERHQDARHAAGGELGDGHRAGAADDEVGLGVAARHVVDEGDQLALHAGAGE